MKEYEYETWKRIWITSSIWITIRIWVKVRIFNKVWIRTGNERWRFKKTYHKNRRYIFQLSSQKRTEDILIGMEQRTHEEDVNLSFYTMDKNFRKTVTFLMRYSDVFNVAGTKQSTNYWRKPFWSSFSLQLEPNILKLSMKFVNEPEFHYYSSQTRHHFMISSKKDTKTVLSKVF